MSLRWDQELFGRMLYAARERKGITQERFAEMVGISQSSLSRIENGTESRPPRIDTVIAIEESLGRRPFTLAAAAFGLPAPGEPEIRSLLEIVRYTDEVTEDRRRVLLEIAELMVAQSEAELAEDVDEPGPRRGRPRRP